MCHSEKRETISDDINQLVTKARSQLLFWKISIYQKMNLCLKNVKIRFRKHDLFLIYIKNFLLDLLRLFQFEEEKGINSKEFRILKSFTHFFIESQIFFRKFPERIPVKFNMLHESIGGILEIVSISLRMSCKLGENTCQMLKICRKKAYNYKIK